MAKRKQKTVAIPSSQREVVRPKAQSKTLRELFEKDIRKGSERDVPVLDGRYVVRVPLLSSEECLELCQKIVEDSERIWEMMSISVAEVQKKIDAGDVRYQELFGKWMKDEDKIARALARYRERREDEGLLSLDDVIAQQHQSMAVVTALREVLESEGQEMVSWLMEKMMMDFPGEMAMLMSRVNGQIGLDRYLKDREKEEDLENDKKK